MTRMAMMSPAPQKTILTLDRTDFIVRIGDIAQCEADVLVSSAGTGLSGERGAVPGTVSWSLRQVGHDAVFDELRMHEPLTPGDVVVTGAGHLRAKHVFHAVVVGWGDKQRVLQATIWRVVSKCMALAQLMGLSSIAFPSLGTGSGSAQLWETHSTLAAACLDSFRTDGSLRRIHYCFLDKHNESTIFRRAFYQQQLIRELRGLPTSSHERETLAAALESLYKRLLTPNADAEAVEQVVKYALTKRSPKAIKLYIVSNYGSGAVAIGRDAKAVGKDGVIVGGDNPGSISTGNKFAPKFHEGKGEANDE